MDDDPGEMLESDDGEEMDTDVTEVERAPTEGVNNGEKEKREATELDHVDNGDKMVDMREGEMKGGGPFELSTALEVDMGDFLVVLCFDLISTFSFSSEVETFNSGREPKIMQTADPDAAEVSVDDFVPMLCFGPIFVFSSFSEVETSNTDGEP